MKTLFGFRKDGGYALMMTLFFGGISLMALAGALQWTSSTARTTERNNRYFATVSAAEAATEKALASVAVDFQASGESSLYSNLDRYRKGTPTAANDAYWGNYVFSDATGNDGNTYIERIKAWGYTALESQYQGLYGMAATYRIVSNARTINLTPQIVAGVKQDVQVAAIPLFQFAIFYTMDLEINPNPPMFVNGRVHSNGNLYQGANGLVTYNSHVTAAGQIIFNKSPLDPTSRTPIKPVFNAEHDGGANSLTLPIGTNNTPAAVRAVLDIPPSDESRNSLMGQQRYYNKADLIIVVSNNTVTATSGAWDNFNMKLDLSAFVTMNTNGFYDKREGKTMLTTEIDIGNLITWDKLHPFFTDKLGRDVNSIYVADMRKMSDSSAQSAVRVKNGQTLPDRGLTIASPNPLYVQGNYNAPAAALGTTNTLLTKPASLVADAITVLSGNWKDTNATTSLSTRIAANTTVNAAFLGGIVESNGSRYSGGVENFPRFLEDWGKAAMTYNGSMVVMFPSKYAKGLWGSSDVYQPPTRNWAFDLNFLDPMKLPPGTPMILTTIRAKWAMVAPNNVL